MNESSWYRSGTVSLTNGSDLVTGVGTEFVDNVFVGGIFFTPTGLVEVSRIVSDTQLQLVTAYAGPTVAGVEYAIAPTQGAVVAATKQLQAFLVTLGPLKQAWEAGDLNPKGLELKGVKDSEEELPGSGNAAGDGWLVDGVLFVWTGTAWSDQGSTVTTPELAALRTETVEARDETLEIAGQVGNLAVAVVAAQDAASFADERADDASGAAIQTAADVLAAKAQASIAMAAVGFAPNRPVVRLATAAPLPAVTYNNGAGTLTATANGVLTVDGVAIALNDELLVKDQVDQTQNGIYKVTTAGAAGAAFVLTRRVSEDTPAELAGACAQVLAGVLYAGWSFVCQQAGGITLGTTAITFAGMPVSVGAEAAARTVDTKISKSAVATADKGATNTTFGAISGLVGNTNGGTAHASAYALTAGQLRTFSVYVSVLGSGTIDLVLYAVSGGTRQVKWRQTVAVPAAGVQTYRAGVDFPLTDVLAGWVPGTYSQTGGSRAGYGGGGSRFEYAGDPGAVGDPAQAYTAAGQALLVAADVGLSAVQVEAATRKAETDANKAANAVAEYGATTTTVGQTTTTGGTVGGNAHASNFALSAGVLKSISAHVQSLGSGSIDLVLYSASGNTRQVKWRQSVIAKAAGVQTWLAGVDFPATAVTEGWVLGHYTPAGGAQVGYSNAGGSRYTYAGDPGAVGDAGQVYAGAGQALLISGVTERTPAMVEADVRKAEDANGKRAYAVQRASLPVSVVAGAVGSGYVSPQGTTFIPTSLGATRKGVVDTVSLNVSDIGNGSMDLCVMDVVAAPDTFKITQRQALVLTKNGQQTLVAGIDFAAIALDRGQYLGFVSPAGGVRVIQAAGGGQRTYAGDPGSGNFVAAGSSLGPQMTYTLARDMVSAALPWLGKSVKLLGDSIFANAFWVADFLETTGMVLSGNRGVVGQLLQTMADGLMAPDGSGGVTIGTDNGNMTGVAVALIGTSINNWHHSDTTPGAWGDSASANTVFGAVRNVMEKVYASNPDTMPIFVGPYNAGGGVGMPAYGAANGGGMTITDLTAAQADACGRYGAPFYPTQRLCWINEMTLPVSTTDKLHVTPAFGRKLGRDLGVFVNQFAPR